MNNIVKQRESNFELLRILSMFGVLLNHTLQYLYDLNTHIISVGSFSRSFIMNVCIVAVNCFVLISGYFGIKLSVRGIVKYYSQCLFYALVLYGYTCILNSSFNFTEFVKVLFACSETKLWFVPAYFALMLLSPIINVAFNSSTSRQRVLCLLLLLFVDVYLGYMHQRIEIGRDGFELFHLLTVYYCGRFISSRPRYIHVKWGILALLFFALMTGLHFVKLHFFAISVIYSLHYQSPCLLIASFLVFQWARNISLKSDIVNWVASSVFAVYLIHSNPHFWHTYTYWLKATLSFFAPVDSLVVLFPFASCFFMFCVFIDKIRVLIIKDVDQYFVGLANRLYQYLTKCIS